MKPVGDFLKFLLNTLFNELIDHLHCGYFVCKKLKMLTAESKLALDHLQVGNEFRLNVVLVNRELVILNNL